MPSHLAPVGAIQPGLERISQLLKNVKMPWKSIHVAGTNGKGSICAYASAMFRRKQQHKTGLFTSPHLINRWDCIAIDHKPVEQHIFESAEREFLKLNTRENIGASEFEILTATAFKIFTDEKVKIGIVEVGMGGGLDTTNILQNQIVSVISKIGLDHQQYLGNTIEEIAAHKAGILRPGVPYIVNDKNTNQVQSVIDDYAQQIGAGPRIDLTSSAVRSRLFNNAWKESVSQLADFQKDNALCAYSAVLTALEAIAIEKVEKKYERLKKKGEKKAKQLERLVVRSSRELWLTENDFGLIKAIPKRIEQGDRYVAGRAQRRSCCNIFGTRRILLDGAHNVDAAKALAKYVNEGRIGKWDMNRLKPYKSKRPKGGKDVTWILAMSAGRNALEFLSHLLQPGDNVITVEFGPVDGMPWVKPTPSGELLRAAFEAEPNIKGIDRGTDVLRALYTARFMGGEERNIVVTGSLYLVGQILRLMRNLNSGESKTAMLKGIARQEQNAVKEFASKEVEADEAAEEKELSSPPTR
jgi:folylpolyglutamate synthase